MELLESGREKIGAFYGRPDELNNSWRRSNRSNSSSSIRIRLVREGGGGGVMIMNCVYF